MKSRLCLFVLLFTSVIATNPAYMQNNYSQRSSLGEYDQVLMQSMQRGLKNEALKVKINNLTDAVRQPGTEIRIWVGFGLLYPRCFIMTERNGRRAAFHITAKRVGGSISTPKVPLESPKSGWSEFAEFIKKQGIDSPLKLSFDREILFDPDEEAIAIEIKSPGKYEMIFYDYDTKSQDGVKAMEVCRRIDQEFGIMMGCPKAQ